MVNELPAEKEIRELGYRKELPVYEVNFEEKQTVMHMFRLRALLYQAYATRTSEPESLDGLGNFHHNLSTLSLYRAPSSYLFYVTS